MEIRRDVYLERLERLRFKGGVKIITGVRRGGKSYLLFNIFRDHLLETGIRSDHVIAIALDSIQNRHLRDAEALYKEIASRIIDSKEYYVIIDEIQLAEDFVDIVNGLAGRRNVDLYITGSNSRFLSSDIVTEFRGRGTEINVRPLSFSEYMQVAGKDEQSAWRDYLTYGGLPESVDLDDPDKAEQEARPFLKVNDGFRKLILVGDDVPVHVNGKGVIIMSVIDFMKDPGSLESLHPRPYQRHPSGPQTEPSETEASSSLSAASTTLSKSDASTHPGIPYLPLNTKNGTACTP